MERSHRRGACGCRS